MPHFSALSGCLPRIAGLALALVTVELVARCYAYIPGDGGTKTWHREGNATSHWRHGVRLPVSDAPRRILVLGDSYTAALHVGDTETFSYLTERGLRQAGLESALLNTGVPAYGLPDHILRGRELAAQVAATWTLVVLNDDDFEASSWSLANAHFVWEGDRLRVQPAEQDRGRLDRALKPIRERSATLQNAFLQYKGMLQMAAAWRPFRAEPRPAPPRPKRSYPVAHELALANEVLGPRVTFVHLGVGVSEVTATEGAFRAACQAQALSCVTTREQLAALRRSGVPPQGFPNSGWDTGHLNPWGHQVVAETIVRALSDGLL